MNAVECVELELRSEGAGDPPGSDLCLARALADAAVPHDKHDALYVM